MGIPNLPCHRGPCMGANRNKLSQCIRVALGGKATNSTPVPRASMLNSKLCVPRPHVGRSDGSAVGINGGEWAASFRSLYCVDCAPKVLVVLKTPATTPQSRTGLRAKKCEVLARRSKRTYLCTECASKSAAHLSTIELFHLPPCIQPLKDLGVLWKASSVKSPTQN